MANRAERRAKKNQDSPAVQSVARLNSVTRTPASARPGGLPEPAGTTGYLKATSWAPLSVSPEPPSLPWLNNQAPEQIARTPEAAATLSVASLPGAPAGVTAKTAAAKVDPATAKITFTLNAPEANRVFLSGEFNAWSPDATPMHKQDGGQWAATLALAPGRYQYKFLADGEWIHDPEAWENVPNQHGSLNSVREVRH
jgi:hypothetical protein